MADAFSRWLEALEARHFEELTFQEVARALRALSSAYVERRDRISEGGALSGAGKRAAFALFYGPLHYLLTERIVRECALRPPASIVDLGCGTGATAAARASAGGDRSAAKVLGIDRNAWAIAEGARTYRAFGLRARMLQGDAVVVPWVKERTAIVAGFSVNELPPASRDALLRRLIDRAQSGDEVLVIEPIARAAAPWWGEWRRAFEASGGRADEWRFPIDHLPSIIAKLDRAAGLDHRELTGRTLLIAPGARRG